MSDMIRFHMYNRYPAYVEINYVEYDEPEDYDIPGDLGYIPEVKRELEYPFLPEGGQELEYPFPPDVDPELELGYPLPPVYDEEDPVLDLDEVNG